MAILFIISQRIITSFAVPNAMNPGTCTGMVRVVYNPEPGSDRRALIKGMAEVGPTLRKLCLTTLYHRYLERLYYEYNYIVQFYKDNTSEIAYIIVCHFFSMMTIQFSFYNSEKY